MDETVKVSVVVATYNQERYIGKTLDSIVSQNCDFKYEVLVGDDASKDRTGDIVREYEKKYPDKIKAIVREQNFGPTKNIVDLCERAKGEYVAFLEGDDFWIDECKLRKQVDFLDSHRDYVASFGRHIVVDENDERNEEIERYIPRFDGGEYTAKDFEAYLLPGQTATAMYRMESFVRLKELVKNNKKILPRMPVIDRFLVLGILSQGRIDTSKETYAAYRYILAKGSGSWSSKNDFFSFRNMLLFLYGLKEMERVGRLLSVDICFDERRKYEFSKVADYKGKMSIITINFIRFVIWLWYKDKKDFNAFLKERHAKK